jgi:hypothetical protein
MGYHHPRVDYFIVPTTNINLSGYTLTVNPGTIIAIGGQSQAIQNGKIISNGAPFEGGRIKYMNYGLASAGWKNIKYRNINNGSVNPTSNDSEFSFCDFTGLGYGILGGTLNVSHDNIFKYNYRGLQSNTSQNSLFIGNFIGMYYSGPVEVINCNFDRNALYGLYVMSNPNGNYRVKNCIFTNNGTSGIFEFTWMKPASSLVENNNAFYQNTNHKRFYKSGQPYINNALDSSDCSALPYITGTTEISSDDFYQEWDKFSDRFYLPQPTEQNIHSRLVNGGDPMDGPMGGYTTDPTAITDPLNAVADIDTRDIGYHYPIVNNSSGIPDYRDDNWNGIPDYLEYWGGTFSPECQCATITNISSDAYGVQDIGNYGWQNIEYETCTDSCLKVSATFRVEDSGNGIPENPENWGDCGGANKDGQSGILDITIFIPHTITATFSVSGRTERQDSYVDIAEITVGDDQKVYISGTDEDLGCGMGTHSASACRCDPNCIAANHRPKNTITLVGPETYHIKFKANTGDELFHTGEYFNFSMVMPGDGSVWPFPQETTITECGTIHQGAQAGCWIISSASGTYEPMGLSPDFLVNGLCVYYTGQIRCDISSPCMQGRLLEILEIESCDSPQTTIEECGVVQLSPGGQPGCYRIVSESGSYWPLNLPQEFQVENMCVCYQAGIAHCAVVYAYCVDMGQPIMINTIETCE